jgi:hypothetical protein
MKDPTDAQIIEWIDHRLRIGGISWSGTMLIVDDTAYYGQVPDFPQIDFKRACIQAMRNDSWWTEYADTSKVSNGP